MSNVFYRSNQSNELEYQARCRKQQQLRRSQPVKQRLKIYSRNANGTLSEFGPALVLLFAFILLPALTLLRLGMSCAAIFFIVDRAADAAAKAYDYDSALGRAQTVMHDLSDSGLARFSGLKPEEIEKVSLFVDENVTATGQVNTLTRQQLARRRIDPELNTYVYEVQSSYSWPALAPEAGLCLPLLGTLPFLCTPATITVRAFRIIEYTDGLKLSNRKDDDCGHCTR